MGRADRAEVIGRKIAECQLDVGGNPLFVRLEGGQRRLELLEQLVSCLGGRVATHERTQVGRGGRDCRVALQEFAPSTGRCGRARQRRQPIRLLGDASQLAPEARKLCTKAIGLWMRQQRVEVPRLRKLGLFGHRAAPPDFDRDLCGKLERKLCCRRTQTSASALGCLLMTTSTSSGGFPFALIPAAGRSRRMGTPKLLLDVGGQTVLARLLAALENGRCQQSLGRRASR